MGNGRACARVLLFLRRRHHPPPLSLFAIDSLPFPALPCVCVCVFVCGSTSTVNRQTISTMLHTRRISNWDESSDEIVVRRRSDWHQQQQSLLKLIANGNRCTLIKKKKEEEDTRYKRRRRRRRDSSASSFYFICVLFSQSPFCVCNCTRLDLSEGIASHYRRST